MKVLLLLLLTAAFTRAEESLRSLEVVVSSLSRDALFVEAGSAEGLRPGDRVLYTDPKGEVHELELLFVASRRSSVSRPEDLAIRQGDSLVILLPAERFREEESAPADSLSEALSVREDTPAATDSRQDSARPGPAVKGYLAFEVDRQSREGQQEDPLETSLKGRLEAERLAGLPLELRTRFRLRRRSDEDTRWTSRVPLFELAAASRDASWRLGLGRLSSAAGGFSGLRLDLPRGNQDWRFWGGVGNHADNDRPDSERRTLGAEWRLRRTLGEQSRLQGSLGLHGWYTPDRTEEELLRQTLFWNQGDRRARTSLRQSLELQAHREDKPQGEGSLSLKRLDLRLQRSQGSLEGWLGWRTLRRAIVENLPESLDSLLVWQESGESSLGIAWRMPGRHRLSAEAAWPRDQDGRTGARSLRFHASSGRLPLQLRLRAQLRLTTSDQLDNRLVSVYLERGIGPLGTLSLQQGWYVLERAGTKADSRWLRLGVRREFRRGLFLVLDAERSIADGRSDADRLRLEAGWRFR